MSFRKTSRVEILGFSNNGNWNKVASRRFSSFYMDGGLALDIEAALDTVADAYAISRDPDDYLLIPTRANSSNRPNDNLDGWTTEELLEFDPMVAKRRYSTYVLKPHFVNHNAVSPKLSRGVILDAHYNDANPATDDLMKSFNLHTGRDIDKDEFVETLIAMDMTKDPTLAEAYKSGSVKTFSMGCDVEATRCSIPECRNVATNTWQFCDHIKNKHARHSVKCEDGKTRTAFEWCLGTVFAEESVVDGPADKDAQIQEGILDISSNSKRLSASQLDEIARFVASCPKNIPEPLARLINHAI